MKKLVELINMSPRSISSRILQGCEEIIIRAVGKINNLNKILRNYIKKIINPKPYIYTTINLSSLLSKTHTNEVFYQYGPDNLRNSVLYEGILLFFYTSQVTNLLNNNTWSVDGTFQVVPSPWYQLFTISYIKNNQVFSSIFAIY